MSAVRFDRDFKVRISQFLLIMTVLNVISLSKLPQFANMLIMAQMV